jgi:hypothetical protein
MSPRIRRKDLAPSRHGYQKRRATTAGEEVTAAVKSG